MSSTSKSPLKIVRVALKTARHVLPSYTHRFSPKKFTQHQLFACLVLKTFLRTDYRGICLILQEWKTLRDAIGLKNVPHYTTLQKSARRLMRLTVAQRLLEQILDTALPKSRKAELAAIDSSGFESRHISRYFVKRRSRVPGHWQTTHYTRYPKLGIVCNCKNHMIIATLTARGPSPDINQLRKNLKPAISRASIKTLLADAGYDSESNHEFVREICNIKTIIPPKYGRPTTKLPPTKWRREMAINFDKQSYGQRWQVETVFSMIKRNLGSCLTARSYWAQSREMMLLCLTHNIMILRCFWSFSTEQV